MLSDTRWIRSSGMFSTLDPESKNSQYNQVQILETPAGNEIYQALLNRTHLGTSSYLLYSNQSELNAPPNQGTKWNSFVGAGLHPSSTSLHRQSTLGLLSSNKCVSEWVWCNFFFARLYKVYGNPRNHYSLHQKGIRRRWTCFRLGWTQCGKCLLLKVWLSSRWSTYGLLDKV